MKKLMLAVAIAAVAFGANAQSTGTLKKVADSKKIVIGVRDSSIPFSYLDDRQNYVGYSVEICKSIAQAVQRRLNVAAMDFVYQPVTSATRIPLMANGTVDLECGSTTNNIDRQKQVAFAPTTFVTANRLLVKKTSGVNTLAEMKGKTLVSTNGTTNIRQMNELNTSRALGMTIMTAKDHAEAFLMVETGRAVAFAMDDILLASLAASSKAPTDYMMHAEALSVEPYGIMMRKDDPEFKKVVDDAVIALFRSGDINKIYAKWFESPIPPKGVNLRIPMSAQLKAAIAKPTDSGDPAAYK
jgi:glutamate/aspartate transport system substrate-binding protein